MSTTSGGSMAPTTTASSSRAAVPGAGGASQQLRPRNRRLISGLDEGEEEVDLTSSPVGGATISSRPQQEQQQASRTGGGGASGGGFHSIWGAGWSTLQGIASSTFGPGEGPGSGSSKGKGRARRPLELTHGRTSRRTASSSAPPSQWGPRGFADVALGAGGQEEREAEVRARRRRDMLDAGVAQATAAASDGRGRFKRRTSDDLGWNGSAEAEEAEALVYVHTVQKEDTLSGLAIRYDCSPQVLRAANRMWAHDSVQTKVTMVLPVDACGVKGTPVSGPLVETTEEEDLLQLGDPTPAHEKANPVDDLSNGWPSRGEGPGLGLMPDAPPAPRSNVSSHPEPELAWKHDSWVMLPGDTAPTEIGRLSRKSLGFFPPARRKSFSYSDGAAGKSPSVSFDLPRAPNSPQIRASFASEPAADTTAPPNTAVDRLRAAGPRSARSSSLASTSSQHLAPPPPKWLQGPGGVGTLDRTTRIPGPQPDSLNRILGPHLPNVQPPPGAGGAAFLPPPAFPSILDEDFETMSSAFRTGAYGNYGSSFGGGGGGGPDFARGLSGVETWVRKMATRTYSTLSEASARSSSQHRGGAGAIGAGGAAGPGMPLAAGTSGVGDLIELVDAFEIGGSGGGGGAEGRKDDGGGDGWLTATAAAGSARPDAPLGMSRRAGRSSERAKADKDD